MIMQQKPSSTQRSIPASRRFIIIIGNILQQQQKRICLIATSVLLLFLLACPLQIHADNKIHETGPARELKPMEMDKSGFQPVPEHPIATSTPGMAEEAAIHSSSRVKRQQHPHVHDNSGFSVKSLIELVFCFFLPPAAVALHGGPSFKLHILLNVVLCVLGWVPGILHAIWYCFMSGYA